MAAAPPPSYDEQDYSVASSSSAPLPGVAGSSSTFAPPLSSTGPPADAQRAQAPLFLVETNNRIEGTYLLLIGENKAAPDATFNNRNGSINATVYIDGQLPRPVGIVARNANGSTKLVIAEKVLDQIFDINAEATNGSVAVTLPEAFTGLLTVSARNGRIELGDTLRRRSVIVPGDGQAQQGTTIYQISPLPTASDDKQAQQTGGDRCTVRTTNGSIKVRLFDGQAEQKSASASREGSTCVVT